MGAAAAEPAVEGARGWRRAAEAAAGASTSIEMGATAEPAAEEGAAGGWRGAGVASSVRGREGLALGLDGRAVSHISHFSVAAWLRYVQVLHAHSPAWAGVFGGGW